ncbi:MAG: glycosyltransferase family 39 protein [Candidatus Eremiobacteraeota bacterium]|nr:glycosyltransferase family 39 protein [Candidatus Eremiobacteraeota bacterium]
MNRRHDIVFAPDWAMQQGRNVTLAVALTAGFALLLHLALAGRYDFFRDELYFIACGRHPAFGYVDQPPLVPLLAAATQFFGHNLFLLRAIPAVAAAGTVLVACLFARLAGGGAYAVALTGIAVATAPMYVGIDGTFNTSAFEPLAWTAMTYFIARAVYGDRRALIWAGSVIGIELEVKYQIPFYAVPLIVALLFTPQRTALFTREAAIGAVLAVVIAAPSIVWQIGHGLPFLELLAAGAGGKNVIQPPLPFILNQLGVMNFLFAPVWIAGVVASIASPQLARLRFVGVGFVLAFFLMFFLHAKDYYLAGLYASAFALGAVAIEKQVANAAFRVVYPALGVAAAALGWPNGVPLLDPPQLVRYLDTMTFLRPQEQEKSFHGQRIPQNLADQLGWRELAQNVAAVYRALPPTDQARAAIIGSNYGEAGAIDFYGSAYGLPPTLSGHNQYWLWGTRGYDGSVIIYINSFDVSFWKKHCREAHVAGMFGSSPYVEPYEHNRPIVLCHGFFKPLPQTWALFKNYV